MQLLIILALLLYGGKSNAGAILSDVKPVLESIGGDEMREALKSAEEISSVLSAIRGISSAINPEKTNPESNEGAFSESGNVAIKFPLEPVSAIADKDITYSLSKYISQN